MENAILEQGKAFVKQFFSQEYTGHDHWHTMRVYRLATELARREGADPFIVGLAALLHDVDDVKLSPETHAGKENAVSFMRSQGLEEETVRRVCAIIEGVSFAGEDTVTPATLEGKCVQDGDRLDALGAIGIARTFAYGGKHDRAMYDPAIPPKLSMSGEEYRRHVSTSVNHFYEKLFKLKGLMNTEAAKELAEGREKLMREFMDAFLKEWNGEEDGG